MTTKACMLVSALLLVALLCSPAVAARYPYQLDPAKWVVPDDGICTYNRDVQWVYESDGVDVEELLGGEPPLGTDPRIRQYVLNAGEDVWTDWHVEITNGKNLRDIRVYKVDQGTPWVIDLYTTTLGFLAHVISAGPGNPMAVNPNETLYVEFTYDVDIAGQPVTVSQYPTTWWLVPEPSSIVALLAGVGALLAGRRLKK